MSKNLLKKNMVNSCYDINLEDLLNDSSLPFSVLIDKDKSVYYEDFNTVNEARNFRKSSKSGKEIVPINEDTGKELLQRAEVLRKGRAKHIKVYYQGVLNTKGWVCFRSTSQYTKNKMYTQYIRLDESKDFKYFKEFSRRDIVRLFMSGKISVYCSCPDYKYRYSYMGHTQRYGIFKELRFPKVRNPNLHGSVCKHLIAVLSVFGMNWSSIAKQMTKTKFWKKRYEVFVDDAGVGKSPKKGRK